MHILKIIHGYPPNYNAGSEVYSQSICNELSKTNKVSVFTREENPYAKDFTIRKEIKNENFREIIEGNYRIIYKVISSERIDIITVHHSARDLTKRKI